MNKAPSETQLKAPQAGGRRRPLLSPEVSELLSMLEAFEKAAIPEGAFGRLSILRG